MARIKGRRNWLLPRSGKREIGWTLSIAEFFADAAGLLLEHLAQHRFDQLPAHVARGVWREVPMVERDQVFVRVWANARQTPGFVAKPIDERDIGRRP